MKNIFRTRYKIETARFTIGPVFYVKRRCWWQCCYTTVIDPELFGPRYFRRLDDVQKYIESLGG